MLYQLSYCGNCVVFGCKVNAFFLTGKIFPEFFAQEVGEVLFIVGLRGVGEVWGEPMPGRKRVAIFCSAALLPGCQNRVPSISEGKNCCSTVLPS